MGRAFDRNLDLVIPDILVCVQDRKVYFELMDGAPSWISVTSDGDVTVQLGDEPGDSRVFAFFQDGANIVFTGFSATPDLDSPIKPVRYEEGKVPDTPFSVQTTPERITLLDAFEGPKSLQSFRYFLFFKVDNESFRYDPEIKNEGGIGPTVAARAPRSREHRMLAH